MAREEWLKRSTKENSDGTSGQKTKTGRDFRDKSKVRCFNCQGYGHFTAECKKPKRGRDHKGELNMVQLPDDEPALLPTENMEGEEIALLVNEEKVTPKLNLSGNNRQESSNMWYLDNGASNHMTGQLSKFKDLDEGVEGRVRFRDGSAVLIKGKGSIVLKCKNEEERVLYDVYYIP